jgi:hypothetical protein
MNYAFFFIKPHANNDACAALCREILAEAKIIIEAEG